MKEKILYFTAGMLVLWSFLGVFIWYQMSSPGASEGHKMADARYRLCLERVFNTSDSNRYSSPKDCDGALGEYGVQKSQ